MAQWLLKVLDWTGRAQTLWAIAGSIPAVWNAVLMTTQDMPTHEIILHTSAILAFGMGIAYCGHYFFGLWGERQERMRAVNILRARQRVGDKTALLALVASAWHGNDGKGDMVQLWLWNAKFQRLKRAVESGELKGQLRDKMKSDADIADLIRYFSSRLD